MAVIKPQETSNPGSIEDKRYRQVMAEIDDIFKQGRKEAAQSDGISLQDCIKEVKARLIKIADPRTGKSACPIFYNNFTLCQPYQIKAKNSAKK